MTVVSASGIPLQPQVPNQMTWGVASVWHVQLWLVSLPVTVASKTRQARRQSIDSIGGPLPVRSLLWGGEIAGSQAFTHARRLIE